MRRPVLYASRYRQDTTDAGEGGRILCRGAVLRTEDRLPGGAFRVGLDLKSVLISLYKDERFVESNVKFVFRRMF